MTLIPGTNEPYCWGTTRVKNPKTLERWKQTGRYQKLIDEGYTYAPGCGRFRIGVCTCSDCRRKNKSIKL